MTNKKKKSAKSIFALINALMTIGGVSAQSTSTDATSPKNKENKKENSPVTGASTDAIALPEVVVTAKEEKSNYQGEKVSSSKYTGPLRDTPQTVTVVSSAVMKDQGVSTLRDALRNVPGISFQAGEGGTPAGDQMTIRGFSGRTDTFTDGVRDLGGYNRDPYNLEQVEVIKGPNSTYSGRGSTGASVNLVTKKPKMENFLEADFGYGNADYYRSTVDINQKIPLDKVGANIPAAFRLNGMYHNQDFAGRDFVHNERWAIAPSLAFGLGTDTRAILSYEHMQENNLPSYGIPFVSTSTNLYGGSSAVGQVAPVPYRTFFGLADRDYEKIWVDNINLRLEHDFSDNVKLENQTGWLHTYRDSVISAPRLVGSGVINRQLQSRDYTTEVVSNLTNLITKFETWKAEHTFITSVDYSYERDTNYLRSAPTLLTIGSTSLTAQPGSPYEPNAYDGFSGPITRTGAVNEAYADSIGLSIGDTIKLTDQWILSLGARGDFYQAYLDQKATTQAVTTLERSDLMPTWFTGITYKPVDYGSIYFSYRTSFNPSLEGLSTSSSAAQNISLEPETSESFELGTKWDFLKEKLSLSAAMFKTVKDKFKTRDAITGTSSLTGEVEVQGIEFGAAGNLTDDWKVFAGYTLMESNINKSKATSTYNGVAGIKEEGHELSNTPEQTVSIWTTYKLPFNLELGTGVNFKDKVYANNISTNSVDGYWLQGFMATYNVNEHWDIRFNIQNLWDKEYIDQVGGGHAIPGSGRTAILSTTVKF